MKIVEQVGENEDPSDWDYLMLMTMIHPALTLLFGVANTTTYAYTKEVLHASPSFVVPLISLVALVANFGMQWGTYEKKDLTANLTTLAMKPIFKSHKFTPMLIGFLVNTVGQTFATPSNAIETVVGGENMEIALLSQYIAGVISTGAVTGLIMTNQLPRVAGQIQKIRKWGGEKVETVMEATGMDNPMWLAKAYIDASVIGGGLRKIRDFHV